MDNILVNRERRLRRKACKKELILKKGRRWDNWNGYCLDKVTGYMLLDTFSHCVIFGGNCYDGYELTIEEAEEIVENY